MTKRKIAILGSTGSIGTQALDVAEKRGYEVVGVVKDLEKVKNCDVLIVINASRISRKTEEYYTKINEFKKQGIEVEIAGIEENAGKFIELITRDLHKKRNK